MEGWLPGWYLPPPTSPWPLYSGVTHTTKGFTGHNRASWSPLPHALAHRVQDTSQEAVPLRGPEGHIPVPRALVSVTFPDHPLVLLRIK